MTKTLGSDRPNPNGFNFPLSEDENPSEGLGRSQVRNIGVQHYPSKEGFNTLDSNDPMRHSNLQLSQRVIQPNQEQEQELIDETFAAENVRHFNEEGNRANSMPYAQNKAHENIFKQSGPPGITVDHLDARLKDNSSQDSNQFPPILNQSANFNHE